METAVVAAARCYKKSFANGGTTSRLVLFETVVRTLNHLPDFLRCHDGACGLKLKHAQVVVEILDGEHREAVEEHGLASRLYEPIHYTARGSVGCRSGRTSGWLRFAVPVPPKSLEDNLCRIKATQIARRTTETVHISCALTVYDIPRADDMRGTAML